MYKFYFIPDNAHVAYFVLFGNEEIVTETIACLPAFHCVYFSIRSSFITIDLMLAPLYHEVTLLLDFYVDIYYKGKFNLLSFWAEIAWDTCSFWRLFWDSLFLSTVTLYVPTEAITSLILYWIVRKRTSGFISDRAVTMK